jgi:hypothetical protein
MRPIPGSMGAVSSLPTCHPHDKRIVSTDSTPRALAGEPHHGVPHVPILGSRRLHDRLAPRTPGYARQLGSRTAVLRDDRRRADRPDYTRVLGTVFGRERRGAASRRRALPRARAGEARNPARARGAKGLHRPALGLQEDAQAAGGRMGARRPLRRVHGRGRAASASAHSPRDQGADREVRRRSPPRPADRVRRDRASRRARLPDSRVSFAAFQPARGRVRGFACESHALPSGSLRRGARRVAGG